MSDATSAMPAKALTGDAVVAAVDSDLTRVEIPEWGGHAFLRIMDCGERDDYECEWRKKADSGVENFRSKFVAKCLVDESGKRLFGNGDIMKLAAKSSKVVNRLWELAMKLNNLSEAGSEEAAKNS